MANPIGFNFDNFVKKRLGRGLIGAEIGVWRGGHAQHILDFIKPEKLYLIDPYELDLRYIDSEIKVDKFSVETWAEARIFARDRFKNIPEVEIMLMTSVDAAREFEMGSIDFAYIDGNHDYEFIAEDIKSWYPKIRAGGILGGHDYDLKGVGKAVNEFVKEKKLKLAGTLPDWYFIKEKK